MGKTRTVKFFGVGGAGISVAAILDETYHGALDIYAVDSHKSMLLRFKNESRRILVGWDSVHGLGAMGNAENGRKALFENAEDIRNAAKGADIVFVIAGLGGGIGTGGAPLIAQICREQGAFTVVIVTVPFSFEKKRRAQALGNMSEFAGHSDVLVSLDLDSVADHAAVEEFLTGDTNDIAPFWRGVDQQVCKFVEEVYKVWG